MREPSPLPGIPACKMNAGTVINGLCLLFAAMGAADYAAGGKWGLGREFERGIECTGKLIICMTGFMTLAPVLGRLLTPLISPAADFVGADPSILAGLLLSCDSGGAALAMAMCTNPQAGEFNGYIVSSMLGASVMCIIPMTMLSTDERTETAGIYGLIIGLVTVPVGCLAGGLLAGYPLGMLMPNLVPVIFLAGLLLVGLTLFYRLIVRPFRIFGRLLVAVSLLGLLLAAAQELLGLTLISGLMPFSEIILIIGDIALVLAGLFPMLALLMKGLDGALARMAAGLGVEKGDMAGVPVTAINLFPTLDNLKNMTKKGVLMNVAFMVGGNCMVGDHFAYTSQTNPELIFPVMAGKAVSGLLALAAALLLSDKLIK